MTSRALAHAILLALAALAAACASAPKPTLVAATVTTSADANADTSGRASPLLVRVFELSNNHGRIFGPYALEKGYLFTAAFSREEVDPIRDPPHQYGSFNRARDDFTQRLDLHTDFKVGAFVNLGNALIGDPKLTTGDHDGIAVVVRAGP